MNVGLCSRGHFSSVVVMKTLPRPALLASVLLIAGLALAGCSAGSNSGSNSAPSGGSQSDAVGGAPVAGDAGAGNGTESGAKSGSGSAATVDRSIVVTGTVTITADAPLTASAKAVSIVEGAGGRIDGRTENAASNGDRGSAILVLRIPAKVLNPTLDALRKLGRVDQIATNSTDVTAQTQDLGARIDALRASVARLLQLEAKATTTTDLVAIESALSERQGELESLEAQQRGLNDQISMSTITLTLRSDAAAPPVKPVDFWAGLGTGWKAFVGFWTTALVALGILTPWLALTALALLVALGTRRVLRRRAAARAAARAALGPASQSGVTPPSE